MELIWLDVIDAQKRFPFSATLFRAIIVINLLSFCLRIYMTPLTSLVATSLIPVMLPTLWIFDTPTTNDNPPHPPAIVKHVDSNSASQHKSTHHRRATPHQETNAFVQQGLPYPKHGEAVWDRLAQCEAGGNWHNTSNPLYEGGLQFHPTTWSSSGGSEYAPHAYMATREQQITIGERVQASQGWGAWPACSAQLGLR